MNTEICLGIGDICRTISKDLKSRRITQKAVAEMIGSTKQTVANQLSGKKRFSANMAEKYSDKLGYSIEFLLYGKGLLYAPGRQIWHYLPGSFPELIGRKDDPIMKESFYCDRAAHILEIINDKVAIECFESCVDGNEEESSRLMNILVERYGYNLNVLTHSPQLTKKFREMRDWFRKVEVFSAKNLVCIEQKAAAGENIDIDKEVERFRQRVILIKNTYKNNAQSGIPIVSFDEYLSREERESYEKFFKEEYH